MMTIRCLCFWAKGLLSVPGMILSGMISLAALPGVVSAGTNNILLIIADDYGTDSSALYNTHPKASLPPTPNIERLARQGVLFRNAYSCPTCSPSRSTILTGRYPYRTGIGYALALPTGPSLQPSELTLPEVLDANPHLNYTHALVGKWHLSEGADDPRILGGFSHFSGVIHGAIPDYFDWPKTVNGQTTSHYTNYATTDNVDDALAWIGRQSPGTPWFLWLAFNAAHTPYHKPPKGLHSYQDLSPLPVAVSKNPRPYYEAIIEAMDTEMGRLLSKINTNHTTIFFVGDNGTLGTVMQPPYAADRGKGTLYEGGIRVPMIVSGPAVTRPGRQTEALVNLADLFATILELAGVNLAESVLPKAAIDSRSFLPVLKDQPWVPAQSFVLSESFAENHPDEESGRALRDERYKLIHYFSGHEEFYDVSNDFLEKTNLLSGTLSGEQQSRVDSFRTKLTQLQEPPHILEWEHTSESFTVTLLRNGAYQYSLWSSDRVHPAAWQPVTNSAASTQSNMGLELSDPNPTQDRRFYRVGAMIK